MCNSIQDFMCRFKERPKGRHCTVNRRNKRARYMLGINAAAASSSTTTTTTTIATVTTTGTSTTTNTTAVIVNV